MHRPFNLEQAKDQVRNTISDMTITLSQARQQLQELIVPENVDAGFIKRQTDMISMAKGQVQHIVNEYFKDVSDNYILLQSRYPSNEVKDFVLKQIDAALVSMNQYSQRINDHTFGMQDFNEFRAADFPRIQEEVKREVFNLEHQTHNVQRDQRLSQDQLPQVKINFRVVEGIFLALNEYASTSWLGNLPKEDYEKPNISLPNFFLHHIMPLPVVEDEKCSYGYYNLVDGTTQVLKYNYAPNEGPFHQSTSVVTPTGQIFLIGGIDPKGRIVNSVHVLDPALHTINTLKPMNVKRVACSACYVPPDRHGSVGYIYVFGGKTDNMVKTKLCERYDISRNVWENIPKMQVGKARPACCYNQTNHTIYLFFGSNMDPGNNIVAELFDVQSQRWNIIEVSNYLLGFDITFGAAVQINPNLIMIFGGLRDSQYFKEQMYFNRKILLFNTTNQSFVVIDWQLPIDFLALTNPLVNDGKVYSVGTFLKSVDEQPSLYLDGGIVLRFDDKGPKVIAYVHSFDK